MFTPATVKQFPAYFAKKIVSRKRVARYFGIKREGFVPIADNNRQAVLVLWFQKQHPQTANEYFSSRKNVKASDHAYRWANYQNYHPDDLSWPPPHFYDVDELFGPDVGFDVDTHDYDGHLEDW